MHRTLQGVNIIGKTTLFTGFQNRIIIPDGDFERKLWKTVKNSKESFQQPVGNFVEKANAKITLNQRLLNLSFGFRLFSELFQIFVCPFVGCKRVQ